MKRHKIVWKEFSKGDGKSLAKGGRPVQGRKVGSNDGILSKRKRGTEERLYSCQTTEEKAGNFWSSV